MENNKQAKKPTRKERRKNKATRSYFFITDIDTTATAKLNCLKSKLQRKAGANNGKK
jgi:hypothetical protein